MPRKAAADAGGAESSNAEKATAEEKLLWSIISQMSAGGKLVGVNWEMVQADVGASSKHAAYLRWDTFKRRMKARGLELPTDRSAPEHKAKVSKPKTTQAKPPRKKVATKRSQLEPAVAGEVADVTSEDVSEEVSEVVETTNSEANDENGEVDEFE